VTRQFHPIIHKSIFYFRPKTPSFSRFPFVRYPKRVLPRLLTSIRNTAPLIAINQNPINCPFNREL
jgi:hypothetical protein